MLVNTPPEWVSRIKAQTHSGDWAHSACPCLNSLQILGPCLKTTVYLINMLPTSTLNFEVPYTKLFKVALDYTFLKTFGCSCFPLLIPYNKHKLQFRSRECLFLGYSISHKGYKCLASDGDIYLSKNVVFNEHSFPFKHLLLSNATDQNNHTRISPSIPLASSTTCPTRSHL